MDVTAAAALCRFGRDVAALLVWGESVYHVGLVPLGLRPSLAAGWSRRRRGAILLLAIAVAALLPVEAATLGRGWPDALDPAILSGLLAETTIGTSWAVQAAATVLLLAAETLPARWRDGMTMAAAGLLLAALTLTGHAAMREGWAGVAQRGNGLLHLLAAGFWFGALAPLLPTLRALADPARQKLAAVALRRFSVVGHGAVLLVVCSGIGNVALIVGHWPAARTSPYQTLLVAKIGFVGLMLTLAVVNRYLLVPRLSRPCTWTASQIRNTTLCELALGMGAIALVSIFGILAPA